MCCIPAVIERGSPGLCHVSEHFTFDHHLAALNIYNQSNPVLLFLIKRKFISSSLSGQLSCPVSVVDVEIFLCKSC